MAAPFKDRIHPGLVVQLADALVVGMAAEGVGFDRQAFVDTALVGLGDLELKARVAQVADALRAALTDDAPDLDAVGRGLVTASGPALPTDEGLTDGMAVWPLVTFVERHAVEAPGPALVTLAELTKRFSAEFAIRPFLRRWPSQTRATVEAWVTDPSVHVRRLASEGTRPRLPWGARLEDSVRDPTWGLSLLDRLVDDPELYVRRSVANHLGDVAKDHPDLAVARAGQWLSGRPDRLWVVKHGLRHLVKQGHAGALTVLGFGPPRLQVTAPLVVSPTVRLGDGVSVGLSISSTADTDQALVIDLGVAFVKKRGQRRVKVFKWTHRTLRAGETMALSRVLKLPRVSTRKHYPGTQGIDVRINGQVVAAAEFLLECEPGT